MVKLTEEMVAARTRVSDCTSVKKLNCWGTELTDVSILRKMPNVEVLSLSVNNISSLADFQNCVDLKDLFIRKNNIKDLNEVCYLQRLTNLKNLWLGENPCAEVEGYRLSVLKTLPNLEKLDDKIVTPEEVQTAALQGKSLVHPLSMCQSEISYPQSVNSCSDRSYNSSPQIDDYQEVDKKNANFNTLLSQQYSSNNHYFYEDKNQSIESPKSRDSEEMNKKSYITETSKTHHASNEYAYEKNVEAEESPRPSSAQSKQNISNRKIDKDDFLQIWTRRAEKDKWRSSKFQNQQKPVTRNSNILSAVLCLVKELDYPSLEVVEMAVRSRLDEFEE
uniref:U2A'/phosphoprotein 32 family A C-terminal domain-containing protein n=1 Tax=Trichogramma kaykai TaxID=54128 RepID=A0ABD2WK70_9HYME